MGELSLIKRGGGGAFASGSFVTKTSGSISAINLGGTPRFLVVAYSGVLPIKFPAYAETRNMSVFAAPPVGAQGQLSNSNAGWVITITATGFSVQSYASDTLTYFAVM